MDSSLHSSLCSLLLTLLTGAMARVRLLLAMAKWARVRLRLAWTPVILIIQMSSAHSATTDASAGSACSVELMSSGMPGMMKSARSTRRERIARSTESTLCGMVGRKERKGVQEMKTMMPSKSAQELHHHELCRERGAGVSVGLSAREAAQS